MATPRYYMSIGKKIIDEQTYALTAKEIEILFLNVLRNKLYATQGKFTKASNGKDIRKNLNIEKFKLGLINFIEKELLDNDSFLTMNQYKEKLKNLNRPRKDT